jgi:D-amino peptidase
VRVYISVDMEGIAGINHPHPTDPTDRRYPESVALMIGETNAAIEGALAAGATDILVNDSHWNMYNLLPADVHPSARVLQGQKAWSMVAGARPAADGQPSFDVALFVGYHARAGHPSGTIAHTYSGIPVETRLDGRPTGEYGMNALVLGAWGIPVGMVAGDDVLAEEVEGWLPWAERVIVKTTDGGRSATSFHPTIARTRVREGAERAVRRAAAGELRTLGVKSPVTIEIDVPRGVIADHAAIMPGVERVGDRTVRFAHDDPEIAFRGFLSIVRLVESVSG